MKIIMMTNRNSQGVAYSKEMMEAVAGVLVGHILWYQGNKCEVVATHFFGAGGAVDLVVDIREVLK